MERKAAGFLAVLAATAGCLLLGSGPAQAQDDLRDLYNLAACYTEGIDAIGAGKVDDGSAIWRKCFNEDVAFELRFGTFVMTCPGEKCPLPASLSGLAKRAAVARSTYERSGYVATSHHITSIGIETAQDGVTRLKGHLQAWHVRKDGATVLGLGTWQVLAKKTAAGWRIAEEKLESSLRVVMPKAE